MPMISDRARPSKVARSLNSNSGNKSNLAAHGRGIPNTLELLPNGERCIDIVWNQPRENGHPSEQSAGVTGKFDAAVPKAHDDMNDAAADDEMDFSGAADGNNEVQRPRPFVTEDQRAPLEQPLLMEDCLMQQGSLTSTNGEPTSTLRGLPRVAIWKAPGDGMISTQPGRPAEPLLTEHHSMQQGLPIPTHSKLTSASDELHVVAIGGATVGDRTLDDTHDAAAIYNHQHRIGPDVGVDLTSQPFPANGEATCHVSHSIDVSQGKQDVQLRVYRLRLPGA